MIYQIQLIIAVSKTIIENAVRNKPGPPMLIKEGYKIFKINPAAANGNAASIILCQFPIYIFGPMNLFLYREIFPFTSKASSFLLR